MTTDGLLAIRPGMTYGEVETIIGPPVCIASVSDDAFSPADRKRVDDLVRGCHRMSYWTTPRSLVPAHFVDADSLDLSYAEPRESLMDPNIYVSFRRGRVVSVYVKDGDEGICCMDGQPNSPFYWIGSRRLLRDLIGR